MVAVELRLEQSRFKGSERKKVINWGHSAHQPEVAKCQLLNQFVAVGLAANKLTAFRLLEQAGVSIPRFTDNPGVATDWLQKGFTVVERHKLTGHSGEGIRIVTDPHEMQRAPLYVAYIPKTQEYRAHVVGGKVIDIQRKARQKAVADEDVNWKVRNLANGFIYARDFDEEDLPADLRDEALLAVKALGLDFGAVDLIFNKKHRKSYVLEVNTAPGLQGQTLDAYVKAFTDLGWDNPI
jgi:glutathione synthase/RimK-type ligase-like ATP-grasp enzyme